jgi:hypothetical protein
MLRWLFLGSGIAALAIMLFAGSQLTIFLAFCLLFANFATMCIQFDGPVDRARARITARLRALHPHSDAHQRMETAKITTTAADRRHPMSTMTVLNVITGIACLAMLAWGFVLLMG